MFHAFESGQNAPRSASQLQMMNQANQLVASGQPIVAAPLFAQLASGMEAINHLAGGQPACPGSPRFC